MKRRYAFSVVVYMPFFVLALLAAPFLPLFARPHPGSIDNNNGHAIEPRLPRWLAWFQTPDNSLLGDSNWKATHDGSYLAQVQWLWRNPAYGFAWSPLAYMPRSEIAYTLTEAPDGYRIDGTDGSFEWRGKWWVFRLRTGWQLSDLHPGVPALFLLSIRLDR